MQLADAVWRRVEPSRACTHDDWAGGLDAVRSATADASDLLYSRLSAGEKDVMRLVAHGEPLFGARAHLLALSRSSAQAARRSLVASGDLFEADGHLAVVDPLFRDWIARRLPL